MNLKTRKFPSPYGDFVFQPCDTAGVFRTCRSSCFRPLTGILFFNALDELIQSTDYFKSFPSPYGDFVFQQSLRKALSFLA